MAGGDENATTYEPAFTVDTTVGDLGERAEAAQPVGLRALRTRSGESVAQDRGRTVGDRRARARR